MAYNPLQPIESNDRELYDFVEKGRSLAFTDGALGRKEKLLIAAALDAAHGTAHGVRSLVSQALEAGATRQEVMETLRVAAFISGAGSVYTAAAGLQELFGQ